jgi:hypothetical protein
MMVNEMSQEMGNGSGPQAASNSDLKGKIDELSRSVSEVYKYELLTTNQYLKQMELVLDIFQELSVVMD